MVIPRSAINLFNNNILTNYWKEKPLHFIIFLAIVIRLIAAIFSQGYSMHDDHFLVIEPAQSWIDGDDYNNWLPWNQVNPKPEGHSFFYVGLHYLLFGFFKFLGFSDPKIKMLIVRLLHAAWSLLVVYFGYKIAFKLSDKRTAGQIGVLLALTWFLPFLSIRNLVEMVCIPCLIVAIYLIMKAYSQAKPNLTYLLSGFISGLSFSIRFQTLVFLGGIGLALLIQKKWKESIIYGLGILLSFVIIQGVVDYFIWHRPFAEFFEYLRYNWENKSEYGTNIWYMYISVLVGVFLSPLGFYLLFGFFRTWKKHSLLFIPVFIFIVAHNLFPNKQERFIFTMLPFFIILGMIGWNEFYHKSDFWQKRRKLYIASMIFFWFVNSVLLIVFSTGYSKRARVESMVYLSAYKDSITNILIEDTNRHSITMMPCYYLDKWNIEQYLLCEPAMEDTLTENEYEKVSKYVRRVKNENYFNLAKDSEQPQFILFIDDKNLDERVKRIKGVFKDLTFKTVIKPSYLDSWIHRVNPVNKNMPIYIYKIAKS